jgi:hypothetical protein
MVAIGVLLLLAALLLPAVASAREAGRRTLCSSRLGQLALALSQYSAAHGVTPNGLSASVFFDLADHCGLSDDVVGEESKSTPTLLLCPSDGLGGSVARGLGSSCNFAANDGTGQLPWRDGILLHFPPS